MSLSTALDRLVWIRTTGGETAPPSKDRYGNEQHAAPVVHGDVRARRDEIAASEDIRDRDQQSRTFRYLLALRDVAGMWTVTVTGRDELVDGDETFRIIEDPQLITRRRRPHHWELIVRKIEG